MTDIPLEYHRRRIAVEQQVAEALRLRCATLEAALKEIEASPIPNWIKAIARTALLHPKPNRIT